MDLTTIIILSQKSNKKKKNKKKIKGQFTCLGGTNENYITFSVPIEKEVSRLANNGNKITKTISYRLQGIKVLIVQDLWQAHYAISLIFLLREFIKLNINIDTITKTVNL